MTDNIEQPLRTESGNVLKPQLDDALAELKRTRPQREAEKERYRQNLALSRQMADDYGATYTGKYGGRRRRKSRKSRKSRKFRRH